ncbi:MAG: hypothetical protein ICV83_14335 [Cytophagales bacterium]|nr:hypothetical protein [Cytophagales bacterium]
MIRKIKTRIDIFTNYLRIKRNTRSNRLAAAAPTVLFHLRDIRQEHYYFPIIFSFHEAGYNVCVADHVRFIGHSFGPARYIYKLSRLVITRQKSAKVHPDVLITDSVSHYQKAAAWPKKVLLLPDAFNANGDQSIFLPYPMHPNAYLDRYFENLEVLRQQERKCRILFSGNTDPVAYQNAVIRLKFNKLTRLEVINALLANLPSGSCLAVRKKEEEALVGREYFNGAVLYLWRWSPTQSENLQIRVANHNWHAFLASGDFFLCLSGVVIPQSHNAIEAMSVGAIPILQYAEYFHPPLQHDLNCITFSGEADLLQRIDYILSLGKDKIRAMRQAVVAYYEQYLRHDAAANVIRRLPDGSHKAYFYNEANH